MNLSVQSSHILQSGKLFFTYHLQRTFSKISATEILHPENRDRFIERFKNARSIQLTKEIPKKEAAILIPLCEQDGELSLLYTQRSHKLRSHYHQVSFPGGIKDTEDQSILDCALRETEEEIGIQKSSIEVWTVGAAIRPRTGPSITPVVGCIRNYSESMLKINPDEVAEAFTVPIRQLISDDFKRYTQFRGYSIPLFLNGQKRIWGITGVITYLFLSSLFPKDIYRHQIKYIRPAK